MIRNNSHPRRAASGAVRALALLACALSFPFASSAAAPQDAPLRGPRREVPRWHAFVGATVIPEPGARIENATIVVRDGVIVSVEEGGEPPAGARVWDYTGLVVHAGFVEPYLEVEANALDPAAAGRHWQHKMVTPERSALDGGRVDEATAKALREAGFTAALLAPDRGILRGRAGVVALGGEGDDASAGTPEVIAPDLFDVLAFQTAGWGEKGVLSYPTSEMGAIALARQTFLDAGHHARQAELAPKDPSGSEAVQPALALEALARSDRPLLFVARNELQSLRGASLAAEFGRPMVLVGTGTEFRRLGAIADAGVPVVVPVAFPDAPDVSTFAAQEQHSLAELAGWEQAPTNLRRLRDAGVEVALTSARLSSTSDFASNVRLAIEHGFTEDDALRALTTTPAKVLGVEDRLGRIAPGHLAHLVVREGEPFAEKSRIRDVWVGGERYRVNRAEPRDIGGVYAAEAAPFGIEGRLEVVVEGRKKVSLRAGERSAEGQKARFGPHHAHFHVRGEPLGLAGVLTASLLFEGDAIHGSLTTAEGETAFFTAQRSADAPEPVASDESDKPDDEESEGDDADGDTEAANDDAEPAESGDHADVPETLPLPFGAFGRTERARPRTVVFRGATVWTADEEGIVEGAVVVIENGKIRYVGPVEFAPNLAGAEDFDATGLHITPGLIDCHSHTGISGGVNEGGRRVTSEVRIADVIDPDDMSFYRQLAGGLTAANQLHGSANAIGGQNSVVKLRWGAKHPEELRVSGAKPGIKFALGENPKRVAAGSDDPDEYPQTRMGVEALIRDRLMAGRDHLAALERYGALNPWEKRRAAPPRRDLEIEAMAEIVAGERLIHCHSYRQDEILMLARIAEEFGFRIGTFQHVLEGYKVADAVAASALGASTFADWWAYKFEVVDAIPHNAALMASVGANVSINSDSDEHARRLNTEAAKAVKYGGMDRHEALKLVTLNPAIQLGLGDRLGSIRAGKDADLALWSGDPLSYRSRCVSTWVDGAELYSEAGERELAAAAEAERQRIIQKILARDVKEKKEGGGGADRRGRQPGSRDLAVMQAEMEALWRSGIDPALARPGVCGCFDVLYEEARARAEQE